MRRGNPSSRLERLGRISRLARRGSRSHQALDLLDRDKALGQVLDRAYSPLVLVRLVRSHKVHRSRLGQTHQTSSPARTQRRLLLARVILDLEDRSRLTLARPSSPGLGSRLAQDHQRLRIRDKDLGSSRLGLVGPEDLVDLVDRRGELCRMGCRVGRRGHRLCRDPEAQDRVGQEGRAVLGRKERGCRLCSNSRCVMPVEETREDGTTDDLGWVPEVPVGLEDRECDLE